MRRISLPLALLGAVAAAGCGGGTSDQSGGAKGVAEGTFTITIQNGQGGNTSLALTGGVVTSTPAGIDCGGTHTACTASFSNAGSVVLTAAPDTGLLFQGWAGDCSGNVSTCTLSGKADRYVVAGFGATLTGHPNLSVGTVHAAEYTRFVSGAAGALQCTNCHGASLQGQGIAVGCNGCHAIQPPPRPQPTLALTAPATGVLGQAVALSALATDPSGAAVTCTWSVVSVPDTSTVSLATSGTCSGTAGTASFTPDLAGSYVVRVTASNGASPAQATILVAAQQFGGGEIIAGTDVASADLTEVGNRLHAVLKKGYNNVAPAALAKSLAGLDSANPPSTYAVVDIRLPEDFARGHIPGAVNVPFAELPDVLLANPYFPETSSYTKKIIVAGYNGGDSTMGAVVFNSARWVGDNATGDSGGLTGAAKPAWALKYGMSSWTFDLAASPTRFDNDLNVRRYANTAANTPGGAIPTTPVFSYTAFAPFTGTPTLTQKVLVRARAFLKTLVDEAAATGVPAREAMWTTFPKLVALRTDADPTNDPQMLDVRGATNYTTAHVPGAMFIPYQQVARLVSTDTVIASNVGGAAVTPTQPTTRLIDPAKKVFVQCVTGHTGGHATMALGILGYQARNVLYGMNGWTEIAALGGGMMVNFDAAADANDFPLTASTACNPSNSTTPECAAAFAPSRAGCVNCHMNYLAHFTEVTLTPIPGLAAPISEGEG